MRSGGIVLALADAIGGGGGGAGCVSGGVSGGAGGGVGGGCLPAKQDEFAPQGGVWGTWGAPWGTSFAAPEGCIWLGGGGAAGGGAPGGTAAGGGGGSAALWALVVEV